MIQEFDEEFVVTVNSQAQATGVIRNDDLIGTRTSNTIVGTGRAEFIDGLAGLDVLTGRGGRDRFGFRYGHSRILKPDRITDFRFGQDSISLVDQRDRFRPSLQELSRAADNNSASTFKELAKEVFADADGLTKGNQRLGTKSAALVKSTNAAITGTYLFINNGKEGLNRRGDLLIDITGFTGSMPGFGTQQVESMFT